MHIHILGIGGTFMGGLAIIAQSAGHRVTGCDHAIYPPMSDQLKQLGIEYIDNFSVDQTSLNPDLYIIGNVVTRGNPLLEHILNEGLPYTSGPQWLEDNILRQQTVLAVSGTHGKTSTCSMMTWILEATGREPNFLVGGIAQNFGVSARFNPNSPYFVIESDEYDTAFFDKRSKFLHYPANVAIINNMEFDHADIFDDLSDIQRQFHHWIRTLPSKAHIVYPATEQSIVETLNKACYSQAIPLHTDWQIRNASPDGRQFDVYFKEDKQCHIDWDMCGLHNQRNALACVVAARCVGISPEDTAQALKSFKGIKRRLELRGEIHQIKVFDDFAHHPTAIELTTKALKATLQKGQRVIAVLEPRSNTMKQGTLASKLPNSLTSADAVFMYQASTGKQAIHWDPTEIFKDFEKPFFQENDLDTLIEKIVHYAQAGDQILVMSNGAFGGIHQKLLNQLEQVSK